MEAGPCHCFHLRKTKMERVRLSILSQFCRFSLQKNTFVICRWSVLVTRVRLMMTTVRSGNHHSITTICQTSPSEGHCVCQDCNKLAKKKKKKKHKERIEYETKQIFFSPSQSRACLSGKMKT